MKLTKLTKLTKILRWMLINGVFAWLAIEGLVYQNQAAFNVVVFFIWVVVVSITLTWLVSSARDKLFDIEPSVPVELDMLYDLSIVGLLVWYGHYWYGIMYLWQMIILQNFYAEAKKARRPKQSKQ